MRARDYFPLGVAVGAAFCNRVKETELLIQNLKHGKHTLLMATRRYGKSSLALQALKLSKLPYVEADFYLAQNEKAVEIYILNSIVELIGKALGPAEKLIISIKKFVKNLKPKLDINASLIKLELTTDSNIDPATNVKEGLLLLERLLQEKKISAVLLFDEFQNVGIIAKGTGIEAAIRHVAQKTKYLTFIFSGSHRRFLKNMFEDATRPLYKLCWKIDLERISSSDYQTHLQKAAKSAWQQELSSAVIDLILKLTARHPYYLNKLCDRVWTCCTKKIPTELEINQAWTEILDEEKSDVIKEISSLSAGQKTVLIQIIKNTELQLTSKQTMLETRMTSSSIIAALNGLEEKDVMEKVEAGYQVINPVLEFYVAKKIQQ